MDNDFLKAYQKAKDLNINSTIESVSESTTELDAPVPAPASELPPTISFLQSNQDPVSEQSKPQTTSKIDKKGHGKGLAIVGACVIAAAVVIGAGYVYGSGMISLDLGKSTTANQAATPSAVLGKNQDLADQYVSEISKLMQIPEPKPLSVAQITDMSKVDTSKPFFKNAKNGDVIVIFSTKAILYDPVKKIIVDVGDVNLTAADPATTSAEPIQ